LASATSTRSVAPRPVCHVSAVTEARSAAGAGVPSTSSVNSGA
jgi:hypothetical protein